MSLPVGSPPRSPRAAPTRAAPTDAFADATARFAAAVERLTGGFSSGADRLGLAVSGGADSMAMLRLAYAAFPGRIAAATIDHRLRAESADEATMVAQVCERLGIPHAILTPEAAIAGNIPSAARQVRYALLTRWCQDNAIAWLATAHQGDDQRETMMMRLARGSGVAGLAGVRAARGFIIRPLLDFRRAELRALCLAGDVPFVDDPSNSDLDYDRARMRVALSGFDVVSPTAALRSAAALADADDALSWMVERQIGTSVVLRDQEATLVDTALPRELLRRLLLRCVAHIDAELAPRGDTIDRALHDLATGRTITIGNVLCRGGKQWRFTPAPPRKTGWPTR